MSSFIACLVIFGVGFYLGAHYGYKSVMSDVQQVIDRVEKVHTSKL